MCNWKGSFGVGVGFGVGGARNYFVNKGGITITNTHKNTHTQTDNTNTWSGKWQEERKERGGKICKQRLSLKCFKVSRFLQGPQTTHPSLPLSLPTFSLSAILAILQSCKSFISDNKLPLVSFSAGLSPPAEGKRQSERESEIERKREQAYMLGM